MQMILQILQTVTKSNLTTQPARIAMIMMIWPVIPLRCFLDLKKKTNSSLILIKQRIGVIHLIRSPLILIHSLHQSRRHATVGSSSKSLSSSATLDQRVV